MKGIRGNSAKEIRLKLNEMALKDMQCEMSTNPMKPCHNGDGSKGGDIFVENNSNQSGNNVRNRAHMLKNFEDSKIFKTVSDYKKRRHLFSSSGSCEVVDRKKLKKKTRFLVDTFEDENF